MQIFHINAPCFRVLYNKPVGKLVKMRLLENSVNKSGDWSDGTGCAYIVLLSQNVPSGINQLVFFAVRERIAEVFNCSVAIMDNTLIVLIEYVDKYIRFFKSIVHNRINLIINRV